MFAYSLREISQIVSGKIVGSGLGVINNCYIDSRKIVQGTSGLFFAIKGKNHDGHSFINHVYTYGIRNFVVSEISSIEEKSYPDANFIIVSNVLEALQKISAYHRSLYKIPVIAVIGSNGKTIVKEWLYVLMKNYLSILRSPKSYNSQIGVPLSVLKLNSYHEMAIFEAGISEMGEMEKLAAIIDPKIVLFTNIGNAHQENFSSIEQKIDEKLKMISKSELLIYCSDYEQITKSLTKKEFKHISTLTWGKNRESDIPVKRIKTLNHETEITCIVKKKPFTFRIPFTDKASVENAIHCFVVLISSNIPVQNLQKQFADLPQIAMRLELKEGINNTTIINDTYNSDLESIRIAIDFLRQQNQYKKKTLIISDIQQSDIPDQKIYKEILDIITLNKIDKVIAVGDKFLKYKEIFPVTTEFFVDTDDFLKHINLSLFGNEVILIKGARSFQFEKISKILEYKTHQTILEIDLNAIVTNLNYFKSLLKPSTKLMVMVKAFSYGSGSFEIANLLQHHGVDYLAVAFVDEGVDLRKSGITTPIVVMNPEISSFKLMVDYHLEPEIYNLKSLNNFIVALNHMDYAGAYPIHIKIDTGMKRMGFEEKDFTSLLSVLTKEKRIKVVSIFSHLVGTDEARFDDFTRGQIEKFETLSSKVLKKLKYPISRHILNSAGIERFPDAQFDMVRLGIGLYGISSQPAAKTEHISTLRTTISQIKDVDPSETVGYSRMGVVDKPSKIAVLPIGYADGLDRSLSNGKGYVLIKGKKAPFLGNICMDACMVDVTNIDEVNENDDVIVFGKDLPITEIAKVLNTIPYEILTGISRRVKRVYFQE